MKLFDSDGKLMYEGSQGLSVVTELRHFMKDEIISETLHKLVGTANLSQFKLDKNIKLHVDVKFKCIDDWNRPIFKIQDTKTLLCSVENLFPDDKLYGGRTDQHIVDYYKKHPDQLCIFGTSLNDDPLGTRVASFIVLNFIDA